MSVEAFLSFWDHHNTVIIQFLIGVVLFITIYVAYRAFFGEEEALTATPGAAGLDVGALEKTLQKLLENQKAPPKTAGGASLAGVDSPTGSSSADLDQLKAELALKEKALEDLKAANAAGAESAEEKKKLQERVKDLEGRLAEYEIISEDIADLSFYKEENGKLQKEIETLRQSTGEPVAAATAASAPLPSEPILAVEPPATAVAPSPEVAAPPDAPAAPAAAPAAQQGTPPPNPAEEVPQQGVVAAAPAPAQPNPDDSKLMNQFEDFVKKG